MISINYTLENKTKQTAKEKLLSINEILLKSNSMHHSFLGGSLGLLYYYYHASKVLQNSDILQEAEELLESVFNDINETGESFDGSLFGSGAAGFAYIVNYLQENKFIEFEIDASFKTVEKFMFPQAIKLIADDNIDFLHGALGIVHYFTTRAGISPTIKNYLNILTNKICLKAIEDKDGIWFRNTSLERLKVDTIADFGLAHGLTGILLILINAWHFLDDKALVEEVIKKGINFILSNKMPVDYRENEYSYFPSTIDTHTNVLHRTNRLAWCYGDINQVLLFYRAGKLFGRSFYTEKADEIGFKTIERTTEESTLCNDTHFCHGTTGLAQFYKCLYRESGHPQYNKMYEYWIRVTIEKIENEIATNAYADNPVGILEGWSGIAMVLTDYIAEEDISKWDKIFLL